MIYLELFKTFLLIGMFSFGGGYASMELIRSRVVAGQHWLTGTEYTDIISIAEMTPGPLGIDIASFVGTRTAGLAGTIIASLSYILPALVIVMLLAKLYERYRSMNGMRGIMGGLRPAVAAMVLAACARLVSTAFWEKEAISLPATNPVAVLIAGSLLLLLQRKKIGPIQAILLSGIVGGAVYGFAAL